MTQDKWTGKIYFKKFNSSIFVRLVIIFCPMDLICLHLYFLLAVFLYQLKFYKWMDNIFWMMVAQQMFSIHFVLVFVRHNFLIGGVKSGKKGRGWNPNSISFGTSWWIVVLEPFVDLFWQLDFQSSFGSILMRKCSSTSFNIF